MSAFKVTATLEKDGSLTLDHLPFRAGERVEIVVAPADVGPVDGNRYPLRGSVIRFDDPTEPVADTEWEAQR